MSHANKLFRDLRSDLDQSYQLLKTIPIFVRVLVPSLYVLSIPVEQYWGFNFDTTVLRLSIAACILIFAFQKKWPLRLSKHGSVIWFLIVTLSLPFTYGAIVLLNAAVEPVGNELNVLPITEYSLCLLFLVQTQRSILLTIISWFFGTLLALITLLFINKPNVPLVLESILYTLPFTITVFTLGGILHNALGDYQKDKEEAIWSIATSIAHQLRTPLATMQNLSNGVSNHFESLVVGYKTAQDAGLNVPYVNPKKLGQIETVFSEIVNESEGAKKLIDILIANSKPFRTELNEVELVSVRNVLETAIHTFPYNNHSERARVFLDGQDFNTQANRQLLLHVFYNLIANAVEFAQKNKEGIVDVRLSTEALWNTVTVHDTGTGIAPEHTNSVFEPFFSRNTMNGTGIGLPFCKSVIESIGGKISISSVYGEHTTVTIQLPKIEAQRY